MTNFNDIGQTSARKPMTASRQPLIPAATIRSPIGGPNNNNNNSDNSSENVSQSRRQQDQAIRLREPSKMRQTTSVKQQEPKQNSDQDRATDTWSSMEDLFWDHMEEVQNKWDTLKMNDDIWAKLIYFEQNRRLAKAYVSAPILTIDGSTNGLDGFRIGLSGIDNTYRNLDSVVSLRSIGQGVKLKIDSQGNILIRKIAQSQSNRSKSCSVWIRDWPSGSIQPSKGNKFAPMDTNMDENCLVREIEQSDTSYKLFDMRRFRHHLERQKLAGSTKFDWRQCVSIVSFVQKQPDQSRQPNSILQDPCWIMIINIIAMDMIKSTICDTDRPTTLAHQHNLLHGRMGPTGQVREAADRLVEPRRPCLKASSSTSVLYQPAQDDLSQAATGPSNEQDGGPINLLAKKARTSNLMRAQRRPSSLARTDRRHYQSSQQLSTNSNTIYTTFNGLYLNSRPPNHLHHHKQAYDHLSTSDYYSGSRSSTNGYAANGSSRHGGASVCSSWNSRFAQTGRRHHQGAMASNNQDSNDQESARAPFARGQFVRQLEHKRSQSSSDLVAQKCDFKPIQSAIRMNYDHLSEAEDFYEHEDEELSFQAKPNKGPISSEIETEQTSKGKNSATAAAAAAGDTSRESTERRQSSDLPAVNHNECQAMHNSGVGGAVASEGASQKMSRSSLTSASSSSSSGCADNDYFMSHSSSSISTASNERDLSSQPASSSGIACSGNTSDEYDYNRKPIASLESEHKREPSRAEPTGKLSSETHEPSNRKMPASTKKPESIANTIASSATKTKIKTKTNGRGYRIKRIEPYGSADCPDCGAVCDCEPAGYDCDCCCNCLVDLAPLETPNCCDCDNRLIYDCLAAPKSTRIEMDPDDGSGFTRDDKFTRTRDDMAAKDSHKKSDPDGKLAASKHQHNYEPKSSSPGWLEKRKYSRILPKFIFSSSNSGHRIVGESNNKTGTQSGKSNTLEGRTERFRLTRSTQDLS